MQVVHVKSHTKGQSLDELRNAEIDEAVQARGQSAAGLLETRIAVMPRSWYTDEGKVIVPKEETSHVIRIVHKALGHVEWERVWKWLHLQDVIMDKPQLLFKKTKEECKLCAEKGGRRRVAHNPLRIATMEKEKNTFQWM